MSKQLQANDTEKETDEVHAILDSMLEECLAEAPAEDTDEYYHYEPYRLAQFLLSMWDGQSYGARLESLAMADRFKDMVRVMKYMAGDNLRHSQIITDEEIQPVIDKWGEQYEMVTSSD